MKAHVSLACWPGLSVGAAAMLLTSPITEPLFGVLSTAHVQLVAQSLGQLTGFLADSLMEAFPATRFRLHANVRVLSEHQFTDLANFKAQKDWFGKAASIRQRLGAPAYTAHAGHRRDAALAELLDNARRCADLFGCPVGIEGMYPANGDPWLVSTWPEYRALLDSGVPYALDLSHLNILACQSRERDDQLVSDLLASPVCLEVHVSDNDGVRDSHWAAQAAPWWMPLLRHVHQVGETSALASERGHTRKARAIQRIQDRQQSARAPISVGAAGHGCQESQLGRSWSVSSFNIPARCNVRVTIEPRMRALRAAIVVGIPENSLLAMRRVGVTPCSRRCLQVQVPQNEPPCATRAGGSGADSSSQCDPSRARSAHGQMVGQVCVRGVRAGVRGRVVKRAVRADTESTFEPFMARSSSRGGIRCLQRRLRS